MGNLSEIKIRSTIDGSEEPVLFFRGSSSSPPPLLVHLHSWSNNRQNNIEDITQLADRAGFNAIFPEFRGPNLVSNERAGEACASQLAMQDIVDAAESLCREGEADPANLFLAGGSGGAHMALMSAGYRPELWRAVIASCPITDLVKWHAENRSYAPHIEACCGGPPDNPERVEEYKKRSPAFHAESIAKARAYILHGKHDRSVPFTHSMELYNMICSVNPGAAVYLEIFDGGHEHRADRVEEIISSLCSGDECNTEITG